MVFRGHLFTRLERKEETVCCGAFSAVWADRRFMAKLPISRRNLLAVLVPFRHWARASMNEV